MFKPMLAPNEKINLDEIQYPLLASRKLDGIRCLFIKGEMLSRSLKSIPNIQLREIFRDIIDYTRENNVILDGEIFDKNLTFQQITHHVMTIDLKDEPIPELNFHCFDIIRCEDVTEPFCYRVENVAKLKLNKLIALPQVRVNSAEEVRLLFEETLALGLEGLILRDPEGRYKCGRGTVKEGLIYKVKPWETFDAKIVAVIQSTEVNEGTEKKTNELGRSVTSKKKDDRHTIEKASAFMVYYNELPLKVTLAMTDEEKEEVWKNQNSYFGRIIEYKAMKIGMKELPRHPVFVRFREDKD